MFQPNQEMRPANQQSRLRASRPELNQYSAVNPGMQVVFGKAAKVRFRPGFPFANPRVQTITYRRIDHFVGSNANPRAKRSDESTMNYVLQVVRGRSASTTLKLADGVTSIGRHDDCLIRIKSSQVSRRHCEVFEVADKLTIRDLGSSNGTFVNGKKVAGQQVLKPGDELTVGAVTLRVAKLGQAAARRQPAKPHFQAQGR